MKRKWMLFAIVALCLAGCGKKERTPVEETAVIFTRGQGFSKDGITFLESSIVKYTDFATGETIPLCSRPNCPHRLLTSEEMENGMKACMAYVANAYEAVVYREKLYVFTEENGIRIYVSEADGSNRRLLAKLENVSWSATFSTFFSEDSIVVITSEREICETGEGEVEMKTLYRLCQVDCGTGKVVWGDCAWEHRVELCGMDGGTAYISEDYTLPEVFEKYTEDELDENPDLYRPYRKCELWRCSLADGTAERLLAEKLGADCSVSQADTEGAVLAVHRQNEEEKYSYYSFATGEEKEIPVPREARVLQMGHGSILFADVDVIYRYFRENGKIEEKKLADSLMPIRMLGGNLYCRKDELTVVTSLQEVLDGKAGVRYQMQKNCTIYDTVK